MQWWVGRRKGTGLSLWLAAPLGVWFIPRDRQDPLPYLWPWVWVGSLTGLHFVQNALDDDVASHAPPCASFPSEGGRTRQLPSVLAQAHRWSWAELAFPGNSLALPASSAQLFSWWGSSPPMLTLSGFPPWQATRRAAAY